MATELIKTVQLPIQSDQRGSLVALEALRQVPFTIKRLFYIFGVDPRQPRGFHAHKKNRLALICLTGQTLVRLDNSRSTSQVMLNQPNLMLIIEPKIWHSLENFANQTIILACNSEYYNEKDYIRDYQYFKQYVAI